MMAMNGQVTGNPAVDLKVLGVDRVRISIGMQDLFDPGTRVHSVLPVPEQRDPNACQHGGSR